MSRSRARSSRRPGGRCEEDEQFGERRGDVLPPELATAQGRSGWLREAKRRLDAQRAEEARRSRGRAPSGCKECKRRLEEELEVERRAATPARGYRARGRMKEAAARPAAEPSAARDAGREDQRHRSGLAQRQDPRGWVQGYNAQAVVTEEQIVIAAEVDVDTADFGHLEPMVAATATSSRRPGSTTRRRWCSRTPATGTPSRWRRSSAAGSGARAAGRGRAQGRRGRAGTAAATHSCGECSPTEGGGELYRTPRHDRAGLRRHEVQPPHRPFLRRGRAAARSEWRMITASHNLSSSGRPRARRLV